MESLRRLFGVASARLPPLPKDGDDIFPVHMLDGTKTLQGIIVTWTLRFNDVLDANRLHASLSKLLEIGDWRKVGGRLRLKDDGKLEIYVPQPFTTERPAVTYSHLAVATGIEDHPLAKTLPKASQSPTLHPGPESFRAFAAREGAPTTLQDFIINDTPQLSLHITSFIDATLVALSWPHTLMDVMGQQALLKAWSLVLAGRESEVPPILGAQEDMISTIADAPLKEPEELKVGQKQLVGWNMVMFGLRFAWGLLWNQVVETQTICLPQKAVARLRSQAQAELAARDGGEEDAFISDGDVLTAWATKMVASSLPQPRPVTVLHALNTRFRLPTLIQSSGVYITNMAVGAFTFLSAEVATGPLGDIALENLRHLAEQSTEGQVLAYLRKLRQDSTLGGDPAGILCGESNALLMPFTNWTRADFFKTINFSPAVVHAGETGEARTNPPGTIVYHHSSAMQQSAAVRNVVVVLGKDHGGNYWITGILLPRAWAKIEAEIKEM